MTFGEFQRKVGVISLLTGADEYQNIFRAYSDSSLHKDQFLNAWREKKKLSLCNTQKPQITRANFFCA